MTVDSLTIFLGVIVAVLPFLGFPHKWLQILLFIVGLCVIILGIVTRRRLNQKLRTRELPFDEHQ